MEYTEQNIKEILEAFESIEKHDLKPSTIICTVCGCVFSYKEKDISILCEHLMEMVEDCKDW